MQHSRNLRARTGRPARANAKALGVIATAWLALFAILVAPARGQSDDALEGVFGGLGTAEAVEAEDAEETREGEGSIVGQLIDGETGAPIAGATVIVLWPTRSGSVRSRQEIEVTDYGGSFEFPSIPEGTFTLSFVKAGYRASQIMGFEVRAGEEHRADFPMPKIATAPVGDVLELDAFVVDVTQANDLMQSLELRLDSDQLLNIMGTEDLAKFAAGDVAEALNRMAGVNVVEGQFAIIRGLEDRYSSTLFNGAPVPSPDPRSQSVQLDLFPSDVVSNLVVAKTFDARAPGNSAAGSIDIVTTDYPEELQIKVSLGTGFEENAVDRFLGYNEGSSTGKELSGKQVIESDIGGSIGGRKEVFDREVRFKMIGAWETDYRTAEGFQESREPRRRNLPPDATQIPPFFGDQVSGLPFQSGELSYGLLSLSEGRWELTQSERDEQKTGFGALGFDLDEDGRHRIDASVFYTQKELEVVQYKENGFIPGFDYQPLVDQLAGGDFEINPSVFNNFATLGAWIARDINTGDRADKHQFFANMTETAGASINRDLLLYQLNGSHEFDSIDGLRLTWAGNQARTTQVEQALRSRITNTPLSLPTEFPVRTQENRFVANASTVFSEADIEENQDFARIDALYERRLFDLFELSAGLGGWYERSKRSVDASFLAEPVFDAALCRSTPSLCLSTPQGGRGQAFGATLQDVGRAQDATQLRSADGSYAGNQDSRNDSEREVWSVNLDSKLTFWDDLDILSGVRLESIQISSKNDATFLDRDGDAVFRFGSKDVFPTRYLFFDRQDNPAINELPPRPGQFPIFNDEILGIDVPVDPATELVDFTGDEIDGFINGDIDETFLLPTVGLAYRPINGLNLRAAYSRTVARPSFRELGYYVTVPIDRTGLEVGNPQLGLSKVQSVDGRAEYNWGDAGDLVAFSAFYKTIQDPIEQIVIRDPVNSEATSLALFRTFFNNPNEATLWGVEFEFRKNLGFLSGEWFGYNVPNDLLEFWTIGGNATYINAEVKRTEAQRLRADGFFGTVATDPPGSFSGLSKTRRLFGQPEWIANADLSFDHPDWGTRLTLAVFAISSVLDAAGTAGIGVNGQVDTFTIDQYIDSFHRLDLVFSQELGWGFGFKASVKNLTDSARGIIYDEDQTSTLYRERRLRIGRDYSFAITYRHAF